MARTAAGATAHVNDAKPIISESITDSPVSRGARAQAPTVSVATAQLRESLRELLAATVREAFGIALDKVEELAGALEATAAHGGLTITALLGGTQAHLEGRHWFWGAATRAISSLSPGAKAALVLAMVLALILLPVTALLLLLALIVCVVLVSLRGRAAPTGSRT
jgi:hypothetical protein